MAVNVMNHRSFADIQRLPNSRRRQIKEGKTGWTTKILAPSDFEFCKGRSFESSVRPF